MRAPQGYTAYQSIILVDAVLVRVNEKGQALGRAYVVISRENWFVLIGLRADQEGIDRLVPVRCDVGRLPIGRQDREEKVSDEINGSLASGSFVGFILMTTVEVEGVNRVRRTTSKR